MSNPLRVRRPPGAPPDLDAPEPPPRWLVDARILIHDALASSGGASGPLAESGVTLGALLGSVEADDLPTPTVFELDDGSLSARWDGPHGAAQATCKGRLAVVSAWLDMTAARAAFLPRDERGYAADGPEAAQPLARLRLALAWATGDRGSLRWMMEREASAGRKDIGRA